MRAVAYCTTNHAMQLGAQIPTRSPRCTPRAIRPRATCVDRRVELGVGQSLPGRDIDDGLALWMSGYAPERRLASIVSPSSGLSDVPEA